VYDATRAKGIRTDIRGNLSAEGLSMHLLTAGDSYDMNAHTVRQAGDAR
jgi:hypothetical protein